jgi:FdhD protein
MPRNDRPPASRLTQAQRIDSASGIATPAWREIASEIPVSFIYGDAPYAVMMASPGDAEDFAFGFSLTEGIVRAANEIRSVRVAPQEKGLELHIELAPGRFREHLARRRAITGRTSCGLCGVETVEQLPHRPKGSSPPRPSRRARFFPRSPISIAARS